MIVEGVVVDANHNVFRVRCEIDGAERIVSARLSSRVRFGARVLVGDRVRVDVADDEKGRITCRL